MRGGVHPVVAHLAAPPVGTALHLRLQVLPDRGTASTRRAERRRPVGDVVGEQLEGAEFYTDPTEYGEGPKPSAGLGDQSWIDTEAGHVMWVRGDTTVDVHVPLGGPSEAELLTVARAVDEDLG